MTAQAGKKKHGDGQFEPEKSTLGRAGEIRKGRWRRVTIGACAGLLLAGLGAGVGIYASRPAPPVTPGPPCASCLSVKPVNAAMQSVMQAITKENALVARSTRTWVSVALLNPFTYGPGSDVTTQRMVDQLRGAYLGQLEMNGDFSAGIGVRLILVNEGTSTEENQRKAVLQVENMERSDRIVAVAGLGVSNAATADAAAVLSRDGTGTPDGKPVGMPMFGAVPTADRFTGQAYPGLVQVTPDVTAQLKVAASALKPRGPAILVYDQTATDYYTQDMQAAFKAEFGRHLVGLPRPYTPGLPDTSEAFGLIAGQLCFHQQAPSPLVLYAGRQTVLDTLIGQIQADPTCAGKRVSILTAGDADGLDPGSTAAPSSEGQVAVIYTDITDDQKLSGAFTALYRAHLTELADAKGHGLTAPWMTTSYDMMMAAWSAIHAAYQASSLPHKWDVRSWVDQLNGQLGPIGATGPLSLDSNGKLLKPDIPVYEDTAGKRVLLSPAAAASLPLS